MHISICEPKLYLWVETRANLILIVYTVTGPLRELIFQTTSNPDFLLNNQFLTIMSVINLIVAILYAIWWFFYYIAKIKSINNIVNQTNELQLKQQQTHATRESPQRMKAMQNI